KIVETPGEYTVVTSVFSGKKARGIYNTFIDEMEGKDISLAYPVLNALTQPIRKEAKQINDVELMSLWAGQGTLLGREQSVQELVDALTLYSEKEVRCVMIEVLKTLLGSRKIKDMNSELQQHSEDESSHEAALPDAGCYRDSKEDIQAIMNFACKYKTPVVWFGIGSGLEGQAIPVAGGVVLNFSNMKHIVDFSPEDMTVTVEPGITRTELNQKLNKTGLQFPIDPGADASIGGMTATNASGTTAVKYGSMRDQILDMEIVLADGRVIHTGSHAKKSSSGYHL